MVASVNGSILSELNKNNDHGIWLEQRGDHKLNEKWNLRLKTEQRCGSNYRKFWQYQYEGALLYKINSSFTLGPGYNATKTLQRDTLDHFQWVWFNRYFAEVYVTTVFKKWTLQQRYRPEYIQHFKPHYIDHGLFRYRLILNTPLKLTSFKINPYISNEWFFRDSEKLISGYFENRFRIGFDTQIWKHFSPSFYWQWRAIKQKPGSEPGWFNAYHWGMIFNYNF